VNEYTGVNENGVNENTGVNENGVNENGVNEYTGVNENGVNENGVNEYGVNENVVVAGVDDADCVEYPFPFCA
jgi:hypothetical protein